MSVVGSGERWLVGSDMYPRKSGTFDTHLSKTCNLSLNTPGPGTYVKHGLTDLRSGGLRTVSSDSPQKFCSVEGASLDQANLGGLDRATWFHGKVLKSGLAHCPYNQNDTLGPAAHNLGGMTTDGRSPSFKELAPSHRRPKQTIGKAKRFRELERAGMVQSGIQMIPMPGPGEYIPTTSAAPRSSSAINMAAAEGKLHHTAEPAARVQAFGMTRTGISSDPSQRTDDKRGRTTWMKGKMHASGSVAPDIAMQRTVSTAGVVSDYRFNLKHFSSFGHSSFNAKCQPNAVNKLRASVSKKQSRYTAQPQQQNTYT